MQSSMGLSVVLAPSKHVSHANESIKVNKEREDGRVSLLFSSGGDCGSEQC